MNIHHEMKVTLGYKHQSADEHRSSGDQIFLMRTGSKRSKFIMSNRYPLISRSQNASLKMIASTKPRVYSKDMNASSSSSQRGHDESVGLIRKSEVPSREVINNFGPRMISEETTRSDWATMWHYDIVMFGRIVDKNIWTL